MSPTDELEVMEYEIMHEEDPNILSRVTTKRLANGWGLFGNPFQGDYSGRKFFCQAVVRTVRITHAAFEVKYGDKAPAISTEILKKAIVSRSIPPKA